MRKSTALTFALLMTGTVFAGTISDKAKARFKSMNNPVRSRVAVMTANPNTTKAFQLKEAGLIASPGDGLKIATARIAESETAATLQTSGFGMIYGPEGETWFYTQETEEENYMYKGADITIYDNRHNKVGNISLTVPEGTNVNFIEPYGQVTTKMFDNNEKTKEVAVYVHYITRPGYTTDSTFIYTLDGDIVRKYEGQIADVVSIRQNAWTTVQRAILQRNDDYENKMYPDTIFFDIIKPMGWGDTEPTVEHTFAVNYDMAMYSDGPMFSIFQAEGEPYYVLSYYQDTYVTGYDPSTWDPIVRENNPYVIDVYNKNYERVDSFGIYSDKPDDTLYRMYAISMFSDKDVSKGFFTDDDKLSYIITTYDYLTSSDDYRYSFDVYDGNGNKLKNICDNVVKTYFQLADIKGEEEQWGFLQTIGTTEQIQTVNLPSCTNATTIPAVIDGKNITATVDRYAADDSYKYVIKLTYAESDEEGNVLAPIMWFNKDLTVDRYVTFNIGPNGENFSPLFTNESLDPYLFDTDNEHEYIYIAKQKRENSTVIDNVMVIANEDGSIIRELRGDDVYAIYTGGLINYGSANPELYCATKESNGTLYNIEFFSLPFKKFAAGGDGTEENPYLVSTLGDLMLMKTYPDACFKLDADIDMGSHNSNWSPVKSFSGQLDGNGHKLTNLVIDTKNSNAGLFGSLEDGSKVSNLVIVSPTIKVNGDNSFVGVIAGAAMTDSIDNVHVCNAEIIGTTDATVGGLVGQVSNFSEIKGSSFDGIIDMPAAVSVGGIAGDIRTSSSILACSASGKLTASTSLGGIAGLTVTGASIADCHANVELKAKNTVGGIIGNNTARATVTRCIVEGTIEVSEAKWSGLSAGGIVGYMEADWTRSTNTIVSLCVSTADIIIPEETTDETVHRIVGWTIANENYEQEGTILTEIGLANNYSSGTVGGNVIDNDDNTSTEGMTKNKTDFNSEFFTDIYYNFGSKAEEPWKETKTMPVLWFENTALALTFNPASLTITEGNAADVIVTIYGTDASEISLSSSDTEVATLEITDETDNTVTVRIECKKAGIAVINAVAGNVSATCTVNAVASGISTATAGARNLEIRLTDSQITAEGASKMALYNAGGQLVKRSSDGTIATAGLGKGIFIVKAEAADGNTVTEKVIVK
ncbi:MAG: T9SS type A sorting domain-containing protein [Prevotella sp.]